MKKVLNILLVILVLFGIIGCADPIDPSKGGGNAFIDGGVTLSIEKIDGATECYIQRKNLTKGEEGYTYSIGINEYGARNVKDYFVTPGDTYEYKIVYQNRNERDENNNWKVLKTTTSKITADKGVGELKSEVKPAATYDSATGIMHFSSVPKFSALIENFVANTTRCESGFSMSYGLQGQGDVVYVDNITENVNCPNAVRTWAQDCYNKELTFGGISAHIWVDGVNYNRSFDNDFYSGIPQKITVPDTRSDLLLEATAEGIKITFPQGWERAERVNIERYVEVAGETRFENDQTINTWDLQRKNISEIIDYFVDKGKTYKYKATFMGDNWNDVVLQTKLTSVTANNGGAGELKSTTTPAATYDASTGIMNFSTMPKWPEKVNELISKKSTTNWENYGLFKIVYNLPGWGWVVNENIKEKTDLFANIDNEDHYRKELTFNGINTAVRINGVDYSKLLKVEGFPKTVTVVDTRPEITAIGNENGIEIKLPAVVLEGTEYFTIGRQNVNYPTNDSDMLYWYIKCSDMGKQSIIDYFVTPGQTYEYTVYYRQDVTGNNGKILKKSKPVQFTASNGMKEGFLDPSTTVSYNENTGIMSLNPVPNTSKINSLLKKGDFFEPRLWYSLHDNGNRIWGMPDSNGNIDWVSQAGNYDNGKYLGTTLKQYGFQLEAKIDGISYGSWYVRDDLKKIVKTIPDSIVVPDNRVELKLTPTADGIIITLPEDLKGAKECNIQRRIAGSDDWYSMNTSILNNKEITDYFVDNGVVYEYSANFSKYLGAGKGWETVLQTKTTSVTATGGKGDIKITNNPSATYDTATSVMTFTELPVIKPNVSDFIGSNNQNRSNLQINYGVKHSDGGWSNNVGFDIKQSMNLAENINEWNKEIFGKTLTLNCIDFNANINGVKYYKRFKSDSYNLPKNINIEDTRAVLTLESTTEGIKITFPKDLKGAEECSIYRRIAGSNSGWDRIEIYQNNFNSKIQEGITDYFVDKGVEYEYYANFSKNWNTVLTTKSSTIQANNGQGELKLSAYPVAEYDENTSTLTITKLPVLDTNLQSFATSKNGTLKNRIGYAKPNGGVWDRIIEENNVINYGLSFNKGEQVTLNLDFVESIVDIDGISYGKYLPSNNYGNLPQSIKVTGSRQ